MIFFPVIYRFSKFLHGTKPKGRQPGIGGNMDLSSSEASLRPAVLALAQARNGSEAEYLFAKFPGYAVLRHPNQKWYAVIMDLARSKLGLPGQGVVDVLNVKCDPRMTGSLQQQPGILPAYHMNKESWVTVLLDGTVELGQIAILLDISYDIVDAKGKKK